MPIRFSSSQEELAKFRAVMQINTANGVIQIEEPTTWQWLAHENKYLGALVKRGSPLSAVVVPRG